jgi:hypothetical protein
VGADHRISAASGCALTVLAALGALPLSGCHRRAASQAPIASATASAPPVDRLAPGELAPGTEDMYGLLLPRGMRVSARFPRVAHATGPMHAEDVANYVRDRVDVKRVELGAVGTVFPAVHVVGGDPTRTYRVEVNSASDATEIVMHDVTPIPPKVADPTESEADKWKRAGYKPNGMPLDPMNQR